MPIDESIKKMNYPAASSELSPKDGIYFIVASDGVLNPQRCNKGNYWKYEVTGFGESAGNSVATYRADGEEDFEMNLFGPTISYNRPQTPRWLSSSD